jgi:hypothetical protein
VGYDEGRKSWIGKGRRHLRSSSIATPRGRHRPIEQNQPQLIHTIILKSYTLQNNRYCWEAVYKQSRGPKPLVSQLLKAQRVKTRRAKLAPKMTHAKR